MTPRALSRKQQTAAAAARSLFLLLLLLLLLWIVDRRASASARFINIALRYQFECFSAIDDSQSNNACMMLELQHCILSIRLQYTLSNSGDAGSGSYVVISIST